MKKIILTVVLCFPLSLNCAARGRELNEAAPPHDVRGGCLTERRSSTSQGRRPGRRSVAAKKAERLARKDALTFLKSLERYEVLTSASNDGWRVTIRLKDKSSLISGGCTDYLISKKGDRIIDRKAYQ